MLSNDQIKQQSMAAYNQWCVQWREHAIENGKHEQKSLNDFHLVGTGRPVLLVGNGYSLEREIEVIKKHSGEIDILCCDKSLGHLIERGIKVTYCAIADANVNYEEYMQPYEDKLQDTILISNVCANPKWANNGNWKDKYFVVNKDSIKSEAEFCKLSGCENIIPAGTNVSNSMVVLMTQSDEKGRQNFFGYDKAILVGYDFSWDLKGSYYAFDKTGGGKANYMKHLLGWGVDGQLSCTSNNLVFSAKWLRDYVSVFNLPVVQCSHEAVTGLRLHGKLSDHIGYKYKTDDAARAQKLALDIGKAQEELKEWKRDLNGIIIDHEQNMINTI